MICFMNSFQCVIYLYFLLVKVEFASLSTVKCTNHCSTKYLKYILVSITLLSPLRMFYNSLSAFDLSTKTFIVAMHCFSVRLEIPANSIRSDNVINLVSITNAPIAPGSLFHIFRCIRAAARSQSSNLVKQTFSCCRQGLVVIAE